MDGGFTKVTNMFFCAINFGLVMNIIRLTIQLRFANVSRKKDARIAETGNEKIKMSFQKNKKNFFEK